MSNGGNGSRAFTTRYPLARKALANAMEALPLSNSRGTVKHSALPFNLTHLYGAPGGGEGPQGLEWEARKASILATVKDREAALAFVAQNQAKLDKMYQAKQEHVAAIDKTAAAAETQKKTELKVIRAAIDLRQKEEAERQRETEERRQKATDAKQALVSANEEESEAKASLVLREQELMVAGGEALQRADGPIVTWYQMEEIQRVYSAMLGMRDESDTDERWQDWQEVLRIIYDCEEDTEFRVRTT